MEQAIVSLIPPFNSNNLRSLMSVYLNAATQTGTITKTQKKQLKQKGFIKGEKKGYIEGTREGFNQGIFSAGIRIHGRARPVIAILKDHTDQANPKLLRIWIFSDKLRFYDKMQNEIPFGKWTTHQNLDVLIPDQKNGLELIQLIGNPNQTKFWTLYRDYTQEQLNNIVTLYDMNKIRTFT